MGTADGFGSSGNVSVRSRVKKAKVLGYNGWDALPAVGLGRSIIRLRDEMREEVPIGTLADVILGGQVLYNIAVTAYLSVSCSYGSLNPSTWSKIDALKQERAEKREQQVKYAHELAEAHYKKDFNRIFSINGLADNDPKGVSDGYFSFREQVEAYTRAGRKGPYFESRGASQFGRLSQSELERAIKSYESGQPISK